MKLLHWVFASLLAMSCLAAHAGPAEFDIHFTVITEDLQGPDGSRGADRLVRRSEKVLERFQSHVDRLNSEFRSQSGEQLIRFRLKSATLFDEAKQSSCASMQQALAGKPFEPNLGKCTDPRIRVPNAVNVYVYTPTVAAPGHLTSHGRAGALGPYALIHWKKYHDFNTVMHELGHAFGLPHVCSNPRPEGTEFNIMASGEACHKTDKIVTGFHFDEKQTAAIKDFAERYQRLFARQGARTE